MLDALPVTDFDLTVSVKGDTEVDSHHTIEDTGIVLGHAIAEALGDKAGIKRYGYFILPMDETLALGAVDLSGRPYLNFQAEFTVPSSEQWIPKWFVNFSMPYRTVPL